MKVLSLVGAALALLASISLAACGTMSAGDTSASQPFTGLGGTSWRLVEFQSMDDAQGITRPDDPNKYTITFNEDGTLAIRLDCNRGFGSWQSASPSAAGGALSFGPLGVTRAMCPEPSMDDLLANQLDYVRSFVIANGQLNMALMADGGIIVWEPITSTQ